VRSASPAAVVLVAAFVVAAGALAFLALRIAGAERSSAEQEVRRRLRASVESEAERITALVAHCQERAATDATAVVLTEGRFVAPEQPRPLLHLSDSGGHDRIGDSMLAEAERLEADRARVAEAESIYRRLAAPATDAAPAMQIDRRLAMWRLAALLQRTGRGDEAAAERSAFLELLEGEERATVEGLLARLAKKAANATDATDAMADDRAELRRDLLVRIGGGDDEVLFGMLRESGRADEAALAARRAEVAAIERLRPLLPELAKRPSGAACDADGRLVAWTRADDGRQRIVPCDYRRVAPEPTRGDLSESVDLTGSISGMVVVAAASRSEVDAETRRRVRWITGALATLFLIGGGALYWTLRAVRREREAAQARAAFVARVSHDLRTPLSVIRMYAETIASGRAETPAQVREFAGVAARESERLTALVGQILDFSRATTMKAGGKARAADETIDVGALLAEAVEELRGAARAAGMDLSLSVNGNDLRVRGDRAGLKAALINLVTNALLHASSGGRAEIKARVNGGEVEIRVSDRGPGIPRELGQRIFEPFVRGPQARPGGSGLGLALVREVATRHGGRAIAEERLGGGAVFTLALPRAEPPS
jgi:signal transduction histidine kinase